MTGPEVFKIFSHSNAQFRFRFPPPKCVNQFDLNLRNYRNHAVLFALLLLYTDRSSNINGGTKIGVIIAFGKKQ
jgi:hypothetical protein